MPRSMFFRSTTVLMVCGSLWLSACTHVRHETETPDPLPLTTLTGKTVVSQTHRDKPVSLAVTNGVLALGLTEATLTALERNVRFQVDRIQPAIVRADETLERAAFDTVLSAGLNAQWRDGDAEESRLSGRPAGTDTLGVSAGLNRRLATGTDLALSVSGETAAADGNDFQDVNWDLRATQALLRGRGATVNLAALRRAEINSAISDQELRGLAEALVAQVERAYWNGVLAERAIAIFKESLAISLQEMEEVKARIEVGSVAATELAAVEAEVAGRREQLIEAHGARARRRLDLIRLLNLADNSIGWDLRLDLHEDPECEPVELDNVETYVRLALTLRAEIEQARLQVERGELELVRTRNGLLPRLDLFVALGGSRYAASFRDDPDSDGTDSAYTAGLTMELPFGNRAARSRHERARLSQQQIEIALHNLEQLIQVEVRVAHVDVKRAAERVKATAATRRLRRKTLENEQEKFRVGRSTTFLVAQARRDLVASQIAEVESIIGYRTALLELYRLNGSLLPRKGITLQP